MRISGYYYLRFSSSSNNANNRDIRRDKTVNGNHYNGSTPVNTSRIIPKENTLNAGLATHNTYRATLPSCQVGETQEPSGEEINRE